MNEKIIIDMLTSDYVSIVKERYITIDEEEKMVDRIRTAYSNSEHDRQVISELGAPYSTAVLAIWGNEPTIIQNEEQA